MADTIEQCTVSPSLPRALVTPLELALLSGFGFSYDKDDEDDTLFFYGEENVRDEFEGKIERTLIDSDPSPLAKTLRGYLVKAGLDKVSALVEELPCGVVTWEHVFQTILRKPENRGEGRVKEVVAMAAYTCTKLLAGEFGGWCALITQDSVKHDSTHSMIERMRRFAKLPEALALVCELAEGGALDPEQADPSMGSQVQKQQRAIGTVRRFLKNLEA